MSVASRARELARFEAKETVLKVGEFEKIHQVRNCCPYRSWEWARRVEVKTKLAPMLLGAFNRMFFRGPHASKPMTPPARSALPNAQRSLPAAPAVAV